MGYLVGRASALASQDGRTLQEVGVAALLSLAQPPLAAGHSSRGRGPSQGGLGRPVYSFKSQACRPDLEGMGRATGFGVKGGLANPYPTRLLSGASQEGQDSGVRSDAVAGGQSAWASCAPGAGARGQTHS